MRLPHIHECHCAACQEFDAEEARWREWLEQLEEDVIQREYGYEPGEFTVFPSLWRAPYEKGLSPQAAWDASLKALEGK